MSSLRSVSPLPTDSLDNVPASLLPKYEGRWLFRRSRRLMLVLFAAAVTVIVLFSQHPLVAEYTQAYRNSLDAHSSTLPQATASLTAPPATHTPTVAIERPAEPIVFALIMYKEGSAKEGAVLMKSIIMYTTRPLEFHIVCDDVAMTYLESRFRLLTHPLYPITVRFYRLSFQAMVDRIAREGSLNTGHAAGTTGLMKLFMHEVLPESVGKAIFVDTDAFFLTDPALLWDEFSRWGPSVAVSIPYHPNLHNPEWYNASMICSCIMLFDLAKLRSMRLMDSSIYRADHSGLFPPAFAPPTFRKLFGLPGPHGYHHVALGDQSYWWAIVSNHREIFEPLPLDWEVTSCLLDMYGTGLGDDGVTEEEVSKRMVHLEETPLEGKAIHPKLLHFNCLDGVPQYYDWPDWSNLELSLVKRWKPAVEYHVGFKWIWLNRGRTTSPVDIQLIADPLFADQRFAAEHPEHIVDSSTATAQRRRGHIRSSTKLH